MATDFNINDFLGGGSSSNFGNFGDTSTPADFFTPAPNTAPSNPFAVDQFQDSYFNSPQVNTSLLGFQGSSNTFQNLPDSFQNLQTPSFGSPFSPPSFASLERQMQSASGQSNPLFGSQSFEQNASNLISNLQRENESLNTFINNLAPRISSEPGPGLEPFNRFNPTTQQFEQLFGNQSARLPSADVFVKGETGFNDAPRFLTAAMDRINQNAKNYAGKPFSEEQVDQAAELYRLLDSGMAIFPTDDKGNLEALPPGENYYNPKGNRPPTASVEDLNKLLNMQKSQQAQADNQRRTEFMKTDPTFVKAMAEMNKTQEESRAAFDRASDLRTQALENRIPFNATFNYDKQGNKVLAGDSARAAAAGANANELSMAEYRAKAQAMYPGKGSRRLKGKDLDNAARALRDADRREKGELTQRVSEAVTTVKNILDTANVDYRAMGFDDDAIAQGVKSMGSPGAFLNSLSAAMASVSPEKAKEFGEVTAATLSDISIKTPKQYMIKDTGEITTLGYGPGGALARVFPPKFDSQGNIVQNRRIEEFGSDEVQLYETGDFRSDQETLSTLRNEIQGEDTIAIEKLVEFRDLRAQTAQGIDKVIADIGRTFKTIFKQDLSEAEMIEAVASAKFQGLLGSVRLEVLGPGVLTEQDALRLIKSMGGFGFTANRDSAIRILDDIIAKKEKVMGAKINKYNDFRTSNLALRNLRNTEGDIRFEEITFTPRVSLPNL
jgi:hypothetical protein